jgi:nitrate/TMAO reductase-like tetraheme cytochrome c subunit
MAFRFGIPLATVATFILVHTAVAAGAQPSPSTAPRTGPANEDCLACHDDVGKPFAASTHGQASCVDCHSDLAALQEFPHPEKLSKVSCASCHEDIGTQYKDSIHAWAKEKAGLNVAPSCADCHGSHDISAKANGDSRTHRANVPATCGKCHEGITEKFDTSIHAAALRSGNADAPICADCHTAHGIKRADTPAWRLSVAEECGTCHENVVDSFRRTFHGKVTELGFTRVAACADCHGAHDILPASNPASMIAKGRLVETCGSCHEGANEKFVQYDPHPNPRDYHRSPLLWWINQFYTVLIAGCFGFFGLHSLLWFRRERKEKKRS